MSDATMAEMIAAIRADKVVGVNTCSVVDECYSKEELEQALRSYQIGNVQAAVKWARDLEQSQLERALDCRWGDDDDPELVNYAAFKKQCEEFPLAK